VRGFDEIILSLETDKSCLKQWNGEGGVAIVTGVRLDVRGPRGVKFSETVMALRCRHRSRYTRVTRWC